MLTSVKAFYFCCRLFIFTISASAFAQNYTFEFCGNTINFFIDSAFSNIKISDDYKERTLKTFVLSAEKSDTKNILKALNSYKKEHNLNDWLYYQLIRKTAEQISPKQNNYLRYTFYKWYLMCKSGYDARLAFGNNQVVFFIRNEDDISDIPFFMLDDKKYVCLNYHDYDKLFKPQETYFQAKVKIPEATLAFTYHINQLPDFKPEGYIEKQIEFSYKQKQYQFKVKVNPEIADFFKNYPVVDFETYFNVPLSKETYQSLIPILKQHVAKLNTVKGVDYLMRFTRYAFEYRDDKQSFGKEKRLTPEQTLTSNASDCDDRAALFFYLVKEIYNLPMIALLYSTHITMAVQFDKPRGQAVLYNGKMYTVCEPTPQKENLKIGQLATALKRQKYEIVYVYSPK